MRRAAAPSGRRIRSRGASEHGRWSATAPAPIEKRARDRASRCQTHQHDECQRAGRERVDDRAIGVLGMAGDHDEPGGHTSMRDRDARERRRGNRRRNTRHDLDSHSV